MRRRIALVTVLLAAACVADSDRAPDWASAGRPLAVRTRLQRLAGDGATAPRFSPDGRFVAFTRARWQGLWLASAQGGDARLLSDEPRAGYRFAWSPDGRRLALQVRDADGGTLLRELDVESGEARTLRAFEPGAALPMPVWDAAGLRFLEADRLVSADAAFVSQPLPAPTFALPVRAGLLTSGDEGLFLSAPDGSAPRRLLPGSRGFDPVVSPDGTLALVRDLEAGAAGTIVIDLARERILSEGRFDRGCFLPRSGALVLETNEDDGAALLRGDLWASRPDGTGTRQLELPDGLVAHRVDCSPAEDRIVFGDEAKGDLWIADVAVEGAP